MSKAKILLVEDDPNLGSLLSDYLAVKGYDTDWEDNGDKGLKSFIDNQYDICLLDVMMPVKDGFTLANGDPNLTKDDNIYSIRYADVLLMLAECLHRGSGSDSEAMTYIDMVRERAAGPGDNTGNFRTASQVMADEGWSLLELIQYERRAEFAMEGDRWFDLVRSGRANADLFAGDPLRQGNFSDIHLWLPISLEETSVAPNLTEYPDASLFN